MREIPAEESLIEYPCRFPIKVMGANADGFVHADGQQVFEVTGLKVGLVQDAAAIPAAAS